MKISLRKNSLMLLLTLILIQLFIPCISKSQESNITVQEKQSGTDKSVEGKAPLVWKACSKGRCNDIVPDSLRKCLWFIQDGALHKLDIKTEESQLITSGSSNKLINGLCMALEGDHLWIGGHNSGLWMYDIPSNSTMIYNVDNSIEGNIRGLQSDFVEHIYIQGEQIWLYQSNSIRPWGITRFCYKEKEHGKRWRTWNIKNSESAKGKRDGLASNEITGIISDGKTGYLIFPSRDYIYQYFDPASSKFTTYHLFPKRGIGPPPEESKVAIMNPYGASNWGCAAPNYPVSSLLALRESRMWFNAAVQDDGKWMEAGGEGGPCVLCFDTTNRTFVAFSVKSTESRPNAKDGLLGYSKHWCFDGDEIWMGCNLYMTAGVCRYSTKTKEFTHYVGWDKDDIPEFTEVHDIIALPDRVYIATDRGLLRYQKSDKFPSVTKTSPANGAKDISQQKEFSAVFDMPMSESTINTTSVELFVNKALVVGKVSYDRTSNAAIFAVEDGLPAGMECEFVLKPLIQAVNGNPIHWTRIKFETK